MIPAPMNSEEFYPFWRHLSGLWMSVRTKLGVMWKTFLRLIILQSVIHYSNNTQKNLVSLYKWIWHINIYILTDFSLTCQNIHVKLVFELFLISSKAISPFFSWRNIDKVLCMKYQKIKWRVRLIIIGGFSTRIDTKSSSIVLSIVFQSIWYNVANLGLAYNINHCDILVSFCCINIYKLSLINYVCMQVSKRNYQMYISIPAYQN